MKALVIGGSGLVGNNCIRHFKESGWDVVGTHFSYETDSTVYLNTLNPKDENNFDIQGFNPDVIVHCGALTHVDYCETNPDESWEKTVGSTMQVITWCLQTSARLVYISTDYVFDGENGPYTEDAEVNPLGVYARHKLEAEELVIRDIPGSLSLRITNVYGDEERGKNFVARIIQQCKDGVKLALKLPQDQYATPVNAWDVARAIKLLVEDGHKGIYNIASSDLVNRVQLAQRVLSYFPDAEYDMIPTLTSELGQDAARPLLGGLVSAKFLNLYPEFLFSNVDDYLKEKTRN